MMRHFCLGHVSSDILSAWCCDEGAPSSTLHADRIVIIARDKNTPALGRTNQRMQREVGLLSRSPRRF